VIVKEHEVVEEVFMIKNFVPYKKYSPVTIEIKWQKQTFVHAQV
jgi:hypothetical protein